MTDRKPAEVFHPGEFIADELEARGWSVMDLARKMSFPETGLTEIIDGREDITPRTAARLAVAFTVSAEFWLNLQATFDRHGVVE